MAAAHSAGAIGWNLETFRAWALEQVNERSDLATAKAGIIVRQFDMVARYSANAFEVLDWITLGRPEDPDPLLFPAAAEEAARLEREAKRAAKPVLSEAEQKAARDARYAARKARK